LAAQIFWFLASVACVLAFGFAFIQRGPIDGNGDVSRANLAQGQEQDNWLACVVVWSVLLVQRMVIGQVLLVLGSLILGWTAWRTLRRVRILQGQ
jgi:O-antigen/teichoic acid export membrane protein